MVECCYFSKLGLISGSLELTVFCSHVSFNVYKKAFKGEFMFRFIIFFITVSLAFSIFADKPQKNKTAKDSDLKDPIEVNVAPLKVEQIVDQLIFGGRVVAKDRQFLLSPVSGTIVKVFKLPGTHVGSSENIISVKQMGNGDFRPAVVRSRRKALVGEIFFQEGEFVKVGDQLAELVNPKKLLVKFLIPPEDIPLMTKDVKYSVSPLADIHQHKKDKKNQSYDEAKFISKSSVIGQKTGMISGNLELSNTGNFISGMPVKIVMEYNTRQGFLVDVKRLNTDRTKLLVNEQNKAIWKDVTLGKFYGEKVEILDGIKAGESLVVAYASYPKNGDKLKVAETKSLLEPVAKPQTNPKKKKG